MAAEPCRRGVVPPPIANLDSPSRVVSVGALEFQFDQTRRRRDAQGAGHRRRVHREALSCTFPCLAEAQVVIQGLAPGLQPARPQSALGRQARRSSLPLGPQTLPPPDPPRDATDGPARYSALGSALGCPDEPVITAGLEVRRRDHVSGLNEQLGCLTRITFRAVSGVSVPLDHNDVSGE
jgi:hypothetical protein